MGSSLIPVALQCISQPEVEKDQTTEMKCDRRRGLAILKPLVPDFNPQSSEDADKKRGVSLQGLSLHLSQSWPNVLSRKTTSVHYFVWVHQEVFLLLFLVKQGNAHIAVVKKTPPPMALLFFIIQSIFFFVNFRYLLLFISYFLPGCPYICICKFVVLVSFFYLTEGYLRSFNEWPFT